MFFEVSIVVAVFSGWISQIAFQKAILKGFAIIGDNSDQEAVESYVDRCEIISKLSAFIACLALIVALSDAIIA